MCIRDSPFISRTIDSVYSTSLRELNASHYTEAEVHDLRNARTAREKLGAYMTINSSFYQDKLMSWLTSGAVSYTHLDVYKRQSK